MGMPETLLGAVRIQLARAAVFPVSLFTIIVRKRETGRAQLTICELLAKSMELYDKQRVLRKKKRRAKASGSAFARVDYT